MARKYKTRVNTKKDWVTEQLDQYYSSKGISATVRNTKVDYSRYNDSRDVSEIYERYNINQFTSESQFRDHYIKKGLIDDRVSLPERERLLKKMWYDYVHREQLMFTGQYEEIRTQVFKDNYIRALQAIGVPEYYINTLQMASLEEWQRLATIPNTDKTSMEDGKLPHLGGFAYSTKGDNERAYDMEKILGDVIKAAREAGIYMATPEYLEEQRENEEMQRLADELDQEWNNQVIYLKQVIRIIPQDIRNDVYSTFSPEDLYDRALANIPVRTKSGRLRARISKSGNIYIPFIGSQGSDRTSRLLTDIITEFERRGLDLSEIVEGWDDR